MIANNNTRKMRKKRKKIKNIIKMMKYNKLLIIKYKMIRIRILKLNSN